MDSTKDPYRQSRESDTTVSTRQQTSTDSSVETSASSLSGGLNETSESQVQSDSMSVKESIIEGTIPEEPPVPQLQYHHQPFQTRVSSVPIETSSRNSSTPDVSGSALAINRQLTPSSFYVRRSSLPRPEASYSCTLTSTHAAVLLPWGVLMLARLLKTVDRPTIELQRTGNC